jgi:hypothetical protein
MRHSNQSGRGRRLPSWAAGFVALVVTSLLLAACGSSPGPSGPPSAAPTPVITPDPHLTEPVTADQIFRALGSAKLGIVANNANTGGGNPDIVKLINADIGSWPLRIVEYTSAAALRKALDWRPGDPPGGDEAPYAFAALNVLVQYGPISARAPVAPPEARQKAAQAIVAVLDPLLWPLLQPSVVPIASRTPEPTPAPSVAPSKAPAKTPKPSKKP